MNRQLGSSVGTHEELISKAKARKRFTNDLGEVRPCGCGGVNLAIGPMTLHFTADEVDAAFSLDHALAHCRAICERALDGE